MKHNFFSVILDQMNMDVCESMEYLWSVWLHILVALICWFWIGLMTYLYLINYYSYANPTVRERALFVIAHPDDEAMFFGPAILNLTRLNCDVHLLCLSHGDYQNLGRKRKYELFSSCMVLGIPKSNISLMKYTYFPDNPDILWQSRMVADKILDFVEKLNINKVFTFDIHGVSGHVNHRSIFLGIANLCLRHELPNYCKVYKLDSIHIARKYSLILDAPLSYILSKHKFYISAKDTAKFIWKAMLQHKSQMIWYRWLYIFFSRYMYMNTYTELDIDILQFDLLLDDFD